MTASVSLPFASIPVRGRISVPLPVRGASCRLAEAALTTVLLAGAVTGGTVLARAPLPQPIVGRVRCSIAETGAYVVSSAAGLTATSRATGGELATFRCTLPAHLLALYAVAAARASDECTITPSEGGTADAVAAFVRLGLRARGDGRSVVIEPGFAGGQGILEHDGDIYTVLAALLIALLRSDTRIVDTVPLDEQIPNFVTRWSALLVADEFLLPGSGLAPSDYLRTAKNVEAGTTPASRSAAAPDDASPRREHHGRQGGPPT
ncbi:hypothetical protein [Nocardia sp. CA-135398]|uniref:hypothetical protein n=1 Tax=Nocardia sp. CA-135398 TaxID=3239977 RepID=UPI003D995007